MPGGSLPVKSLIFSRIFLATSTVLAPERFWTISIIPVSPLARTIIVSSLKESSTLATSLR